jgi:TonB family protein
MTATKPATHDYEGKRPALLATTLSGLILCIFYSTSLQAVAGATHKTDAELAEAVIGTWELPSNVGFSKHFLTFNADGTSEGISITNDRGSPRRAQTEARWRVKDGYLTREIMKTTPANYGIHIPYKVRMQIESIENGMLKLRHENGDKEEMRRISHLPSLPPPLTSATWVPELSAAEARRIAISAPQPDYPIDARRNRTQGSGMFRLNLAKDGKVDSIQVLKSTGNKTLDDAAERALRQWRFKPGMLQAVNVPINFVLARGYTRRQ